MQYSGIGIAVLALVLGGCGTSIQPTVSTAAKTFNPKLVLSMTSGNGSDGMAILQNKGLQTAMNLTFADSVGDHGVANFLYVRLVRVRNKESWITQSARNPLDLPGGEGVWVSFPDGLSFPIKATWTQVDINGNRSTVSQNISN